MFVDYHFVKEEIERCNELGAQNLWVANCYLRFSRLRALTGRRPDFEFIPGARLGSQWKPYQISAPQWLVQGARTGKLKCLLYGDDMKFAFYENLYDAESVSYEAVRCSDFFVVTQSFNEIRAQEEASRKQRTIQEQKHERRQPGSRYCLDESDSDSEKGEGARIDGGALDGAPSPVMGLMDCLALWLHPDVFPRLEELRVIGPDLAMICPSQMYSGFLNYRLLAVPEPFPDLPDKYELIHWSCWMRYATICLTPLLALDKETPCGLKKLQLAGQNGKFVAAVLFDILKIEMPSLTHLDIDDWVASKLNWDSPSLSRVTNVDALRLQHTVEEFEKLGKLPSLHTLSLPMPTDELTAMIDECIEKGLFRSLRKLTPRDSHWNRGQPWRMYPEHQATYPQSSHVQWDCPSRSVSSSESHIPMPESCHITEVLLLPPFEDVLTVPQSLQKMTIAVDKLFTEYLKTIQNIRVPKNLKLEEVTLDFWDASHGAWESKFREFVDHAPSELLNATKITLVNLPKHLKSSKISFSSQPREPVKATKKSTRKPGGCWRKAARD